MKRALVFLFVALTLTSCSRIRLAYNFADDLLKQAARTSLDLNIEQKKKIYNDIDDYMAWHRKEMLPRYAEYLEQSAVRLEKNAILQKNAREKYQQQGKELEKILTDTVVPLIKPIAELLLMLNQEQLDNLQKRMEERNQKIEKEYAVDPKKRQDSVAKSIIEFWDDWLVELNQEQEKIVHQHIPQLAMDPKAWLEHRREQQKIFLALLREKKPYEVVYERLKTWTLEPEKYRSKAITDRMKKVKTATQEMVFSLLKSLTPEQRANLAKKCRSYAKDFRSLAKG